MRWIARCSAAVFAMASLGILMSNGASAGANPSAETVVHVADFAYKPATLHIHTGQTVLFVNDDDEAHTVTASDKSFDSGGLDTHESWRHTFTKPGTYRYFCALHPFMKAVVIVEDDHSK